jgi:hypothetical protein
MSLLPPGHGERVDDPLQQSTMEEWERGRLNPAPLSRAAVDKITAGVTVLSQGASTATGDR